MRQLHVQQDEYPYFITTNVAEQRAFFADEKYVQLLEGVMRKTCTLKGFSLLGYVIMPDHVHLLVYPSQGRAAAPARNSVGHTPDQAPRTGRAARPGTVVNLMHGIKSFFVYQVRHTFAIENFAWQPGYNSRVVDTVEGLHTRVEYIKHNPVKAGLPSRHQQKPYLYINKKKLSEL